MCSMFQKHAAAMEHALRIIDASARHQTGSLSSDGGAFFDTPSAAKVLARAFASIALLAIIIQQIILH